MFSAGRVCSRCDATDLGGKKFTMLDTRHSMGSMVTDRANRAHNCQTVKWMETRVVIESMEERKAYICGGQGCWLYA